MGNLDELWGAVERACKDAGIGEYEVYYSSGSSISCSAYRDDIDEFSSGESASLSLRCRVGGKIGYASTELLTPEEAARLPLRAAENARIVEREDEADLYDGSGEYRALPEAPFEMPSASALKEQTLACQRAVYAVGEDVADGTECGCYAGYGEIALYNSRGLRLRKSAGSVGSALYAMIDRAGEKQGGGKSVPRFPQGEERAQLAQIAYQRAADRFGAVQPESGRFDVVFDENCMRQILGAFIGDFFAENCQKGLSPLKRERVGEVIASSAVTLVDTPFYEGNPFQIAFDGEGVPTREKKILDGGRLVTLLYNRSAAAKDGCESTGNASRGSSSIGTRHYTLLLQPGEKSKDELLAAADGGIFVTDMKGFHAGASAVTGDFSIDSEGFRIEGGRQGRALKSFTVSGNFFDFLRAIEAVAREFEEPHPGYGTIIAPATLVRGVSVAGE